MEPQTERRKFDTLKLCRAGTKNKFKKLVHLYKLIFFYNKQMNQKKTMAELERISAQEFKRKEKLPIVVVLDNVRSMHNVGSVFRTCDSFLIEKIFLCGITPCPPHRDIQKTALGATETVDWSSEENIVSCLKQLKQQGFHLLAVEQVHNSELLNKMIIERNKKYALIFGNEVDGVCQEAINFCDSTVEIPQLGSKHSLNVSVSAGIVLWQFAQFYYS